MDPVGLMSVPSERLTIQMCFDELSMTIKWGDVKNELEPILAVYLDDNKFDIHHEEMLDSGLDAILELDDSQLREVFAQFLQILTQIDRSDLRSKLEGYYIQTSSFSNKLFEITEKECGYLMYNAASKGWTNMMRNILQYTSFSADSNISGRIIPHSDPSTPLCIAIGMNNVDIVKLLLDAGADPKKYCRNMTPLGHAIMFNRNARIIQLLVDSGADPNMQIKNVEEAPSYPLVVAIQTFSMYKDENYSEKEYLEVKDIQKYLGQSEVGENDSVQREEYIGQSEVGENDSVQRQKYLGQSAVGENNSVQREEYIGQSEVGENDSVQREEYIGQSKVGENDSVQREEYIGQSEVGENDSVQREEYIDQSEVGENNSGQRQQSNDGFNNAKRTRMEEKYCTILQLLLNAGASVNFVVDYCGYTDGSALHYSVISIALMQTLLKAGGWTNTGGYHSKTPLMELIDNQYGNEMDGTELLLQYGADINLKDEDCMSALTYATIVDDSEILVPFLLDAGAQVGDLMKLL